MFQCNVRGFIPLLLVPLYDITNFATGIKAKVENQGQYDEYLKELEPLREELGIPLKEVMYPE